jgi:hypothetical protein
MIMTDLKKIPTEGDEQSISATAQLPGLEIDLWHRRLPGETGEELTQSRSDRAALEATRTMHPRAARR